MKVVTDRSFTKNFCAPLSWPISDVMNGIEVSTAGGSLESWVKWRSMERNAYVVPSMARTNIGVEAIVPYPPQSFRDCIRNAGYLEACFPTNWGSNWG